MNHSSGFVIHGVEEVEETQLDIPLADQCLFDFLAGAFRIQCLPLHCSKAVQR